MTFPRFAIVVGCLTALTVVASSGTAQDDGIAIGSTAPVVTVPDLDNRPVDLGQYLGKRPVLLEYWATWCTTCAALLPRLRAAHERFGRNVEFIGVNIAVNQTPDEVRRYVADEKPPFRVLYDAEGVSTRAYGAVATSYMVIVDRAGRVAYTGSGTGQQFEAALSRVAQASTARGTGGTAVVTDTGGPAVGSRAPDFTLPWASKDTIGNPDQPFTLSQAAGKTVVLAFYPKDFTSGCSAEMKTFTDQYQDLFGPNVVLVGISADSLTTHQRFAASMGMPFHLLSDPDQRVATLYGSAGENGYNRRTVYVIDPKGEVAYREMKFGALDPKAYQQLKAAVQRARG
jgi:thioredoxin-dependent peroxiredoxin